jgi:hypothetical protein
VHYEDLAYFIQHWLFINCGNNNNCDGADINKDNKVDFIDFAVFAENWLKDD